MVRYVKDSPEFSDEDRAWARWSREQSEYKFAVDLQSKMVDARREGREEEREKWQGVVADKDAEIARLREQLDKRL